MRAAGPGVVSFAGTVAGSLHVVIAHAGDLRTSYSFLASVAVRRGSAVAAGDVIGTTGGAGQGHDGSALHFALRTGDTYVDPMALFRPVDLVAVVHLAPTSDAPRPAADESERRGLLAGLTHDFGAASRAVGAGIAATARGATRMLASHLPLPAAAARGAAAWLAQHGHCAAHAPPADGYGGSGHRVMLVAGIESSLTGGVSSLGLPTADLGYEPGEVSNFSYAADGGDYVPPDTEGPLLIAARRLARQMRALERQDPGREVDLLAHSQGGVVVEAFLTQIYKPSDPSYPPIGTVVTLSSPLRGDPGAEAIAKIRSTESGDAALAIADRLQQATHAVTPPPQSAALRDLARGSALDEAARQGEVSGRGQDHHGGRRHRRDRSRKRGGAAGRPGSDRTSARRQRATPGSSPIRACCRTCAPRSRASRSRVDRSRASSRERSGRPRSARSSAARAMSERVSATSPTGGRDARSPRISAHARSPCARDDQRGLFARR